MSTLCQITYLQDYLAHTGNTGFIDFARNPVSPTRSKLGVKPLSRYSAL